MPTKLPMNAAMTMIESRRTARKCAEHGVQLDVAEAHAGFLEQEQGALVEGVQHAPAHDHPEQGVEHGHFKRPHDRQAAFRVEHKQHRRRNPHRNAGQRDLVGDGPVRQVDERDEHERGREQHVNRRGDGDAKTPEHQQKQHARDRFHQGILPTDGLAAMAALGAQHEPAHDRDVVVPCDGIVALRAFRTGLDDRQPARQPVHAYVEKTPDHASQNKREDRQKRVQGQQVFVHLVPTHYQFRD